MTLVVHGERRYGRLRRSLRSSTAHPNTISLASRAPADSSELQHVSVYSA